MTTISQPDQTTEEENESVKFRSTMDSPEVDGGKSKKYMIARAVATLSLDAMDGVCFYWKEEVVSMRSEDFKYETLRGIVLCNVAKFVLSLFSVCDYFQGAVSFPLSHGSLGRPCTDEVIEVIKIAYYGRGMRRQHFISVQHILFGLSLSRVGDIVGQGIFDNIGLPSDLPMLSIYKLSADAAKLLGDEKVGLEHFVIAILYGKLEKEGKVITIILQEQALEEHGSLVLLDYDALDKQLLYCLRESATNCCVESFEDEDIAEDFISRKICVGNTLIIDGFDLFERVKKAGRSQVLCYMWVTQSSCTEKEKVQRQRGEHHCIRFPRNMSSTI